jgi:MFS family permease
VFRVHEPAIAPSEPAAVRADLRADWRHLGTGYRRLLLAVAVFTLGNSTDAFLLLRLTDLGLGPRLVAVLWSLHSLVRMVATYTGGRLSDRVGRRGMVGAGWIIYASVYLAFGLVRSQIGTVAVFLVYGLYFGLTEPAEKAWVADLVPARLRGTAFGGYHGAVGLTALPASLLFGLIWQAFGVTAAFFSGAALAATAFFLLLRVPRAPRIDQGVQARTLST